VLPCTKESNLSGCLKSLSTPEQNELYWDLVDRKMAVDEKAEQNRYFKILSSAIIFISGLYYKTYCDYNQYRIVW
jgi:hypothetical protein